MAGAPFSASYVPLPTGRGRFDLPANRSSTLYLAESPEHAVAEALQPLRPRRLSSAKLRRAGLPLALVAVTVTDRLAGDFADLCHPETLATLGIRPDTVASRLRVTTRPIAASLWDRGFSGLRWWSRFWGDWHSTVVFTRRAFNEMSFGQPEPLTLDSPPVIAASRLTGFKIA